MGRKRGRGARRTTKAGRDRCLCKGSGSCAFDPLPSGCNTNQFGDILKKSQASNSTQLVFKYDHKLKDYDFSTIKYTTFKGEVSYQELINLRNDLRRVVSWYRVSEDGYRMPFCLFVFALVFAAILGGIIFGLTLNHILAGITLFTFALIGYIVSRLAYHCYDNRLKVRGEEIQNFLDEVNSGWSARGLEWRTGAYGAWLMLKFDDSNLKLAQGQILGENQNRSIELKSTIREPKGPVVPLGSVDVAARKIPMQPLGRYQPSTDKRPRANQVSHQTPNSDSLGVLTPQGGVGNDIVVL